jgi:hypothetical protein
VNPRTKFSSVVDVSGDKAPRNWAVRTESLIPGAMTVRDSVSMTVATLRSLLKESNSKLRQSPGRGMLAIPSLLVSV